MVLILVALIVATVISFLLFLYAGYNGAVLPHFGGTVLAFATGISAIVYIFCGWEWLAAEYKMHIINREYGTNYTREEVFYASNIIDTIRELNRQRVEINDNIMSRDGR